MQKTIRTVLGVVLALNLGAISALAASGLKINYGEILVENLQIGSTYSMVNLVNLPLEITNNDDKPNRVKITIIHPRTQDQKPGFSPIPDLAWVSVSPAQAEIGAFATYKTDVNIKIPDDAKYLGQKYQVDIMVQIDTPQKSMMAVALGVEGRLLFSTAKVKQTVEQPKLNMDFSITPGKLVMEKVAVGKKAEILTAEKKSAVLQNHGKEKVRFIIQSLDPKDTTLPKEPNFEQAPSSNMLTVVNEEITLGAGDKQNLKLFVEFPNKPEFKGKNYQFLLSVSTGNATSGARFVPILITTDK